MRFLRQGGYRFPQIKDIARNQEIGGAARSRQRCVRILCHKKHLRRQERRLRAYPRKVLLRPDYIILTDPPLDSSKGSRTALYRR